MAARRSIDPWKRLEPLRRGPLKEGAFTSSLRSERLASQLGIALGVAFTVCFVTGLISHGVQRGPAWFQEQWPSTPVSLYRVTQGLHIFTGIAAIPLLLAKLWVVYPRLWTWPPVRGVAHGAERAGLAALVGGAIFQLATGVMNIFYWYAFPFNFPNAHFAGAWIAIGGLITHIGAKWTIARQSLATPPDAPLHPTEPAGLTRRSLLVTAAASAAGLLAVTLGAAIEPLSGLAILAPRRAGDGPQGLPVNHSATQDLIAAGASPAYRLEVTGRVPRPLKLSLAELQALPQARESLPISCVEGWSTGADWQGVRVRDLLDGAGAPADATILVESLQTAGGSRQSVLYPNHARDPRTLIALRLNGAELHPDHGFPARLIAPDRPGTEQTKWVTRLEVL